MNVEIGTVASQFPEKDYINGIFVAVQLMITNKVSYHRSSKNVKFPI
jgi:hypothetical protein